jgi:hypothetical protein
VLHTKGIYLYTRGHGLPPNWEANTFDPWLQLDPDFPVRNYLEYVEGKPVSASTVFYGRGVAGIYCVATLPEARGKGEDLIIKQWHCLKTSGNYWCFKKGGNHHEEIPPDIRPTHNVETGSDCTH